MSIVGDLFNLDAPTKVLDAGREIEKCIEARLTPPRELVQYVQSYVARCAGQNRWGK